MSVARARVTSFGRSSRSEFAVPIGGGDSTVHQEVTAGDNATVRTREHRADHSQFVWITCGISLFSEFDHHLDRCALIHRLISVRDSVQARHVIEHATRLDPAFEDAWQQLLDVRAHGCRAAGDGDVGVARWLRVGDRGLLGHADSPDGEIEGDPKPADSHYRRSGSGGQANRHFSELLSLRHYPYMADTESGFNETSLRQTRPRRHGAGVPRVRRASRPDGGAEGARAALGARSGAARAAPARSAGGRGPDAPGHLHRVCARRNRRRAVHRVGVRRRPHARRGDPIGPHPGESRRAAHRPRAGRGARERAREEHRPPRSEARQRHAHR